MDKRLIGIITEILLCTESSLNPEFVKYMESMDLFCKNAGGKIWSRQIIAKSIVDWELIAGEKANV